MLTIKQLIRQLQTVAETVGEDAYVEAVGDDASQITLYFKHPVGKVKREEIHSNEDLSRLFKEFKSDMAIIEWDDEIFLADEPSGSKIHL